MCFFLVTRKVLFVQLLEHLNNITHEEAFINFRSKISSLLWRHIRIFSSQNKFSRRKKNFVTLKIFFFCFDLHANWFHRISIWFLFVYLFNRFTAHSVKLNVLKDFVNILCLERGREYKSYFKTLSPHTLMII